MIAIEQFAAFGLGGTGFELRLELKECLVAFLFLAFEEPECLTHDLAGGLIAAGCDATLEEGVKFRGDGDVDGGPVGGHALGWHIVPNCGPPGFSETWASRLRLGMGVESEHEGINSESVFAVVG